MKKISYNKVAKEIAKKFFRVNEVIDGKEYFCIFDTKGCEEYLRSVFDVPVKE
jgi:hypothetical protein